MPQKVYSSLEDAQRSILYELEDSDRILLVRGANSFGESGAERKLKDILARNPTEFIYTRQSPELSAIAPAIEAYNQERHKVLIAVGGGHIIDTAKLILYGSKRKEGPKLFIAAPTTAGSGSESTPFAVYYENGIKNSAEAPYLLPDEIVLDPILTCSLSPKQTAISGMDALAQGIESFWSVNSTEESKGYSRRAVKLALNSLESAVRTPSPFSTKAMQLAANLAGRAIAIAKTTACHAISYPITSRFGIPHGHAVALTLGEIFEYNCNVTEQNCNDKRGVDYVKDRMHELGQIGLSKEILYNLIIERVGLETSLLRLGIDSEGIETIVKEGFNPGRMKNNPVLVEEKDLRRVLDAIR